MKSSSSTHIQGEHNHLERAIALSALRGSFSDGVGSVEAESWEPCTSFFFLELLVCRGDNSTPNPRDHAKDFFSFVGC